MSLDFAPCVEDGQPPHNLPLGPSRECDGIISQVHRTLYQLWGVAGEDTTATKVLAESKSSHLQALYQPLWTKRFCVRPSMRREWFETALVLLREMGKMEEGFAWVLDRGPDETDTAEDIALPQTTGRGKPGKQPRRPLWSLWDNPKRQLHFMTLRPRSSGPNGRLNSMRPSDLTRLEGLSFSFRVYLWLSASTLPPARRIAFPPPPSADDEEEELARVVRILQTNQEDEDAGGAAAALLRGALRYRMLLEICCVRLHATPRCLFIWRLLVDVLSQLLPGDTDPTPDHQLDVDLTLRARAYISGVVIPYLEVKDRHVESLRGGMTAAVKAVFRTKAKRGMWGSAAADCINRVLPNPPTTPTEGEALTPHMSPHQCTAAVTTPTERSEAEWIHLNERLAATLLRICNFSDVLPDAPTLESAIGGVLQYDTVADRRTAVEVELAQDPMTPAEREHLFLSQATRWCFLRSFVSQYLGQGPEEAFDHPPTAAPRRASGADTRGEGSGGA